MTRRWLGRWIDALGSVGAAGLELVRAELEALKGEIGDSGRAVARGVALLLVAFLFLGLALGTATVAAYVALTALLPAWAAALALTGLALAACGLCVQLGRAQLRRARSPVALVRSRAQDHLGWWSRTVAGDDRSPDGES